MSANVTEFVLNAVKRKAVKLNKQDDAHIDRYGNIRFSDNGNEYRYVVKERVIRLEKQIVFDVSIGGKSKEWYRLKSYPIKAIVAKMSEQK